MLSSRRKVILTWLAFAFIANPIWCHAVTILSGPLFTPSTNAPLAGLLQLTTDADSRISVLVSDGTGLWERDFYDYSTNHSVPLLGFKPDQTNEIQVTVYDKERNAYTAPDLLTFVTAPLPATFPHSVVLSSDSGRMEPGYTLFIVYNRSPNTNYFAIMDNSGTVVWYAPGLAGTVDVRQLDDGNLLYVDSANSRFVELNMLGQIVQTWSPPSAYPVNAHDGVPTDHGTLLYLSDVRRTVNRFPINDTQTNPPQTTVTVADEPAVEISMTNGTLLNTWSPLDILDPTRVTYLTYGEYSGSPFGIDNEHANAIIENTNDNSIIVSLRNQNTVFNFTRSGQLKWILGPHALWGTNWQPYLLTPIGTPFNWNYGQHAPMLTPQGTLLIYNDDNYEASPYDSGVIDSNNYSFGIEYSIDETNMTVSEVWNSAWQTNQDRLYTPIVGKTQWLPQTRDILVTYGYVTYVNGLPPSLFSTNATMARIIEYTHDPVPQVVFDLAFFDYDNTNANYLGSWTYRAERVPDLYAHPAEPVPDLTVRNQNQVPVLEFSADPDHTYAIQASTDLVNWTTIGAPVEEGGVGNYDFDDLGAGQFPARFYRVVTQ